MEIALFWFVFSIVVGVIASSRGRSGFGYFVLSVFLSPIIGLILAVALPSLKAAQQVAAVEWSPTTHRKCPDCAELILIEAKVCKHCGKRFDAPETAAFNPEQLASHYGIVTTPDGRFRYGDHYYDKLTDAVRYAQQQQGA